MLFREKYIGPYAVPADLGKIKSKVARDSTRSTRRISKASAETQNRATAQEPTDNIRIPYGSTVRIATMNVQGVNLPGKREEVDMYMSNSGIHLLLLQETTAGPATKRRERTRVGTSAPAQKSSSPTKQNTEGLQWLSTRSWTSKSPK